MKWIFHPKGYKLSYLMVYFYSQTVFSNQLVLTIPLWGDVGQGSHGKASVEFCKTGRDIWGIFRAPHRPCKRCGRVRKMNWRFQIIAGLRQHAEQNHTFKQTVSHHLCQCILDYRLNDCMCSCMHAKVKNELHCTVSKYERGKHSASFS